MCDGQGVKCWTGDGGLEVGEVECDVADGTCAVPGWGCQEWCRWVLVVEG